NRYQAVICGSSSITGIHTNTHLKVIARITCYLKLIALDIYPLLFFNLPLTVSAADERDLPSINTVLLTNRGYFLPTYFYCQHDTFILTITILYDECNAKSHQTKRSALSNLSYLSSRSTLLFRPSACL